MVEELHNGDLGTPELLRRKIVTYALVYTLIALLLVAFIGIFPLFKQLKEAEERELLTTAQTRAVAIGEYVNRISDVARQVTSRSAIRHRLAEFNQGQVSLGDLEAYTRPKLEDALRGSVEALGITRLTADGEQVAQVGMTFPVKADFLPPPGALGVVISDPIVCGHSLVLIVGAPIVDPIGTRLGTDLVAFSTRQLQKIAWAPEGLEQSGVALLGQATADKAIVFFPGRQDEETFFNQPIDFPDMQRALKEAGQGRKGYLEIDSEGGGYLLAYAPVRGTRWGLLVHIDREELFSRVNRECWSVGLAALVLALCGAAGLLTLLRPLTGRMLSYLKTVARLNSALQQEIAERALAETGLRHSEQEWAQTFESITDAVAIVDQQGRLVKMNQAAEACRDILESLIAGPPDPAASSSGETHESDCSFRKLLRSGQPAQCESHQPATNQDFLVSVHPMRDEQGGVRAAVYIARDITRQKQMERLKDEMLSSVSHEMRTPLTAMLGFIEFILENEIPPDQVRDYLQTVHRETQRLNELVSNFLDLQRLQAQLETYHMEPLEVSELLQEAVQFYALASGKHSLALECPPQLPPVRGDARRLGQVLKNLVSNAIRYSPNGGKITLGAAASEECVTVWVKDEGIGIPQEDLEKIFGRFYRVDDSDRRIPGGIGLGLALVREMVKAHGGKVWAESERGKGSTFFFTIPRMKALGEDFAADSDPS